MPAPQPLPLSESLRDVRLVSDDELARDQAAYERGRRDAEKAFNELLLAQRHELAEALQSVLASLRQAIPKTVEDCRHGLALLALEIAQRLVGDLPVSAEMITAVVRDALTHVERTTECTVYLHPDDLALLEKLDAAALPPDGHGPVRLEPSPEVSRGGCLLKTRFGVVDARRETKLEQLQKALET